MSNTETLKHYLLEKENAYLLDDNNNGKTIMLSGEWGSGKTHFWQKQIEPTLKEKLDNKACVYVSLYGKESLNDIKSDVYLSANGKNLLSTEVSTFGMEALSAIKDSDLAVGKALKAGKTLFDSKKMQKGITKLKRGGIICFDDFERKSKNVDLNDLFGFISQLAINLECKVVLILNSDVFQGKEAKQFREVKEKTINKFLYFNPSPKELFDSIFISKENYSNILYKYKDEIFKSITETKELNARIYSQILDNCLEWIENGNTSDALRSLVLITTNHIKNHFVFEYRVLERNGNAKLYSVLNKFYQDDAVLEIVEYFIQYVKQRSQRINDTLFNEYLNSDRSNLPLNPIDRPEEFLHQIYAAIMKPDKDSSGKVKDSSYYQYLKQIFNENKELLVALNYYAYILDIEYGVDTETFTKINKFVRTGILD